MRIEGWQIEGFGIFRDWEVRGLPAGLTVFLGPNEAGKSTLLGFLRAVLFGFPGKRSRSPQYPPLRGGREGGRLSLSLPEGEVAVERFAGRKNGVRVNGSESAAEDLQALLGGADETVFCSVFAFSLSEMQSFEWLRAEQIRERIFSAGIAGAGASARRVIETLEAEAAAMYRQRGGSRVRELLDQIVQAERREKVAQAEAEQYSSLEQEQEKWSARAMALASEEQELRGKQRSLEALIELWTDRQRAQQQLASLDPAGAFPGEPEARLAALQGRMEFARALARRLEEEQSERERARALAAAGLDERLGFFSDRVEEFHGRLALHQERLEALAAARLEQERRSGLLYYAGLGFGACIAFASGWLTWKGEVAGGLAALFITLFAALFLLYRRVTGNERLAGRLAGLEEDVAAWEQPVREWSGSPNFAERLIPDFVNLLDRCRKDREIRAKVAALDEAIAGARLQLDSAGRDLTSAEEALRAFLQESGSADETEFHGRLRMFRSRQQLSAIIEDRETRMGAAGGRIEEWKSESARLLERVARVRTQRDQAVGELHLAEAARLRIAESTAIPAIKAELESLHSELAEAIREYRIATLAKDLVDRTLQEFTRTRQPAVLEEASSAFARITAGAYERILQDEDGESLVALCRDGQRKRPEELSRGTAEQLYLCLRLGLAAEFARRTASLPLIMDDVLVNFDPQRAHAVARELAHFSKEHQVLIFTCHPETARLFVEVAPETSIIQLRAFSDQLSAAQ